jgi:hypothetical protein
VRLGIRHATISLGIKPLQPAGILSDGRMAERTKATVLKTVSGATRSWVRIPLLPLSQSSVAGDRGDQLAAEVGDVVDDAAPHDAPVAERGLIDPGGARVHEVVLDAE